MVFCLLTLGGCSTKPVHSSQGGSTKKVVSNDDGDEPAELAPVGNGSGDSVDAQPDWDGMAQDLRQRVDSRLPTEFPPIDQACGAMLEEAVAFYESVERDALDKSRRLEELKASRNDDQAACVAESSDRAVACVTILLGDRDSEFPWLLDQCSRAYPKP